MQPYLMASFKALPGRKRGNLGSLDFNRSAGTRVAPGARSALGHGKRTETHQGNGAALLERGAHGRDGGVQGARSGGLGNVGAAWQYVQRVQICSQISPQRNFEYGARWAADPLRCPRSCDYGSIPPVTPGDMPRGALFGWCNGQILEGEIGLSSDLSQKSADIP
jgi:hypothetical protein